MKAFPNESLHRYASPLVFTSTSALVYDHRTTQQHTKTKMT